MALIFCCEISVAVIENLIHALSTLSPCSQPWYGAINNHHFKLVDLTFITLEDQIGNRYNNRYETTRPLEKHVLKNEMGTVLMIMKYSPKFDIVIVLYKLLKTLSFIHFNKRVYKIY